MEILRGLYNLLSKKRIRKISLLSDELGRRSQPLRFYRLLKKTDILTDADAAHHLFKTTPNVRYRMLKKRTKQLMLNSLLFLDSDKLRFSLRLKKLNECSRNLHAVNMLLYAGEVKASYSIAQTTLSQALKYQLWEIALPLLKSLRFMASYSIEPKQYASFDTQIQKILKIQQAELLAEKLRLEVEMTARAPRANPSEIAKKAFSSAEQIKTKLFKLGSFNIKYNYLKIINHAFTLQDKYLDADEILIEIEDLYKKFKEFVSDQYWVDLFNGRVYNSIYTQKYNIGIYHAQRALKLSNIGSLQWFHVHKYYFLLLMHKGEYKKAKEVQAKILGSKFFTSQVQASQEEWKIYAGYSHFANEALLDSNDTQSDFKLKKFMNELELLKANKEGLNAAVLILEVIVYFLRKDYNFIISRMEGLQQYKRRNLKIEETTRCRIFIDLLDLIVKNYFEYKLIEQRGSYLAKKLKTSPRGAKGNVENLEIIPFEILWKWTLKKLD